MVMTLLTRPIHFVFISNNQLIFTSIRTCTFSSVAVMWPRARGLPTPRSRLGHVAQSRLGSRHQGLGLGVDHRRSRTREHIPVMQLVLLSSVFTNKLSLNCSAFINIINQLHFTLYYSFTLSRKISFFQFFPFIYISFYWPLFM
jgi:hypothetical protein